MTTKLFLKTTLTSGQGIYSDLSTTAGASLTTGVVNTVSSGTEIQWTAIAGGASLEWVSGRSPVGGFTLSGTMTFNLWATESATAANVGVRARVFKRTAAGSEAEVGGGPYSKGTELTTGQVAQNFTGTPTSTAFAEDDRVIVRFYITNVGTMGGSRTATMDYNAGTGGADGDSWFQLNETVAFKTEPLRPTVQTLTTNGQNSSPNLVASVPSGTVNGDLLLLSASCLGNHTITTPAGWTLIDVRASGSLSTDIRQYAFWRVASTEPASYNVNFDTTTEGSGIMLRIANASIAPVHVYSLNSGTGATETLSAITPTIDSCLLVASQSSRLASQGGFTPPTGFVNQNSAFLGSTNTGHFVSTWGRDAAASFGSYTATWTAGVGSDTWADLLIAIIPAAASLAMRPFNYAPYLVR